MLRLSNLALSSGLLFGASALVAIYAVGRFAAGSPPFCQEGAGRDQRPFTVVKLRTMRSDAPFPISGGTVQVVVPNGMARLVVKSAAVARLARTMQIDINPIASFWAGFLGFRWRRSCARPQADSSIDHDSFL
jgi:lipopolysaccharide/colanic/teichoic acid biosynthesis glycosyltransferase